MTLAETYQALGLTQPTPSLCDDCKYLQGGTVCVGGNVYAQRYCEACKINVSIHGKKDCGQYVPESWAKLP